MKGERAAELENKYRLWKGRIGQWKASGLTQSGYCRLHGFDKRKFHYWKNRVLVKSCATASTFIEIPVTASPGSPSASLPLCLIIDGRFRVEVSPGFDTDTLDRLIRVLARP